MTNYGRSPLFEAAWLLWKGLRCAILAVLFIGCPAGAAPAGFSASLYLPTASSVPADDHDDRPDAPPAADDEQHPVDPVSIRLRLADGTQLSGQLTAWSDQHLEGSFGTRSWSELHYRDAWSLRRRLMDPASGQQWLELGRLLLMMSLDQPQAAEFADRAFARAEQLQEGLSEKVSQIRHAFFEKKKQREEARQERLSTADPESVHWPADVWPDMGPADQHAAMRAVRKEADEIAAEAGLIGSPLDTGHFLLYGDLSAQRFASIGTELEGIYSLLADLLDVEQPGNVFWGRAIVSVVPSEDRLRLVEAQRFQQIVDRDRIAIAHFIGPQAFILIRDDAEEAEFAAYLPHVVTHAFLHRLISPNRLPPWANEGLAEYVASRRTLGRPLEESKRGEGLSFIRNGGEVFALVAGKYGSEAWPGPEGIGEKVGALLVELLVLSDARAFVRWVKAVKRGEDWTTALAREFRLTPQQFAERAVRYYRVND